METLKDAFHILIFSGGLVVLFWAAHRTIHNIEDWFQEKENENKMRRWLNEKEGEK